MPFVQDPKTGKFVFEGTVDQAPAQLEPIKEKKKPKPKPWWQQVANNLSYEVKRIQQDPIKAAQTYQRNVTTQAVKAMPGGGAAELAANGKPLNNIKYELQQLSNPERVMPRLLQYQARQHFGEHAANTLTLGGIQAGANIGRNVLDAGEGSYLDKGGQRIDDMVDEAYRANAQLPPSEMTKEQKAGDDARASLVLNLGLGVATGGVANVLAKTRYLGPAVSALQKGLNPANARTLAGGITRVVGGLAAEEVLSTPLDDNTGGSAVQILGLLGVPDEVVQRLDPVDPGMTRTEASASAFLPNLAAAGGLVSAVGAGGQLLSRMDGVRRARVTEAQRLKRQKQRARQEALGLINIDKETGEAVFTKETLQAQDADPIEVPQEAPVDVEPGQPTAKQPSPVEEDPTQIEYDPTVPESDALGEALDDLDDNQLLEINGQDSDLVAAADQQLRTPGNGYNESLTEDMVFASKGSLAEVDTAWADRLGQVTNDDLWSLANNSPTLQNQIVLTTGKEPGQFTRTDIIDGLKALEDEGLAVLPNRMVGDQMLPVGDISVDPARFQFKEGVDAQGQQANNSLDGVTRWNPDMEGRIQVWRDKQDGKTYVVNGHNRLAKAKSKEIDLPSIRVEFLTAATAEDAMAQGALNNIAQGNGTPFDAAKFFRSRGITDAAQLEQMGIPLKSGLATQGLALSKLPDTLMQQAINGELPLGRALALGGSGLDAEGMIRVNQLASGRDMTERGFSELVQLAGTAPKVDGAAQGGLPGMDEWMAESAIFEQAEIAAKVRAELTSNKNLFGKAAKKKNAAKLQSKAGAQIDTGAASSAQEMAAGALNEFDRDKLLAGTPVNQMLSQAALEMKNGAKANVLVAEILQKMENAAEVAPPQAVKASTDLDEYGFNPAQRKSYEEMSPTRLQAEVKKAEGYLLSDRKRDNRRAKLGEMNDNDQLVTQYLDESPGSKSPAELSEEDFLAKYGADESKHPQLTKKAELARVTRELDRDDWAQNFMRWFEENVDEQRLQMTPDQRDAVKTEIIAKAARNGEVRPPTTPLPDMPKDSGISLDKVADDLADGQITEDVIMALDDELRLQEEFRDVDAQTEAAIEAARREEIGYSTMTVEEKKANGLAGGTVPELPSAPTFQMPRDLAKSAPRFGMAQLVFESDLDRAAYMLRDASKKSKGEDRLIAALEASGYDIAAIRRLGGDVKKRIQDGIQEATGSRRAPQESIKIEIPASEQELYSIKGAREINEEGYYSYDTMAKADSEMAGRIDEMVRNEIVDEIRRISGEIGDDSIVLNINQEFAKGSRGWNTTDRIEIGGKYNFINDVISVNDVLMTPHRDLLSTAYHESFHRFQYSLMTQQEMKVLDSAWGRLRTQLQAGHEKILPIEMQAVGFQNYVRRRLEGKDPGSAAIRESVEQAMVEVYTSKGESPGKLEEALVATLETGLKVFERMWRVLDRVNNFIRGRGFQNADDIYERVFSGQAAKSRALDFAAEAITDDQNIRMSFLDRWSGRTEDAVNSVNEALADVQARIENEKALAMKEGC